MIFEISENINSRILYEKLFSFDYCASFVFKPSSSAFELYGNHVSGWVNFNKYDVDALRIGSEIRDAHVLKIKSFDDNLTPDQKHDLKYKGVAYADVLKVIYFAFSQPTEIDDNGNKVLSNIVEIPLENDEADWDAIYLWHLMKKLRHGEELRYFEKNDLIGCYLAIRGNTLPQKMLDQLGVSAEEIPHNVRIMLKYLSLKEKRTKLSDYEMKQLKNLKDIRLFENAKLIFTEYIASNPQNQDLEKDRLAISRISELLNDFIPEIISYCGVPVYLDERSYAHICMRHLASTRLSGNSKKSLIPYDAKSLQLLIERITHQVSDEIAAHFVKFPTKEFYRDNRMAIEYDGDYFCIRIAPDGRVVTFYPLEQ